MRRTGADKETFMAQRVQGTEDLYGSYMSAWQHMEDVARELFGSYGFDRVETPAIEQVDTFVHGIGESTDVVRKEMFRVISGATLPGLLEQGSEAHLKARQRMALRPEGTAGLVRAAVEHNFVPQGGAPVKCWYGEAMFRGERPQKGRLRQFHQIGIEVLGAADPAIDAEVIVMLMQYFELLGFPREARVPRERALVHPLPQGGDVRRLPGARRGEPTARLRLQERPLPRGHGGRPACQGQPL